MINKSPSNVDQDTNMESGSIDPKKAGCAIVIKDRVRQQISSGLFVSKKESRPVTLWCKWAKYIPKC